VQKKFSVLTEIGEIRAEVRKRKNKTRD